MNAGAELAIKVGKRTGNPMGRPKGWDKERQRQRLRELFFESQDNMVRAQIASASGIKYLVGRERKTGKFVELTEAQTKAVLSGKDDTHELLEVWEKQPSVQAFTDLANRALDKPADQLVATVDHTHNVTIVERLAAGRERVAKARKPNGKANGHG